MAENDVKNETASETEAEVKNENEIVNETGAEVKADGTQVVTKKKKFIPVFILVGMIVFAVIPAIVLIVAFTFAFPKKRLNDKIKLGEKYITQLDYEKAIMTYKEAIEMNPKSVAAYLGIADAYEGLADQQIAAFDVKEAYNTLSRGVSTLENGYEKTKSKEVDERLTQLKLKADNTKIKPVAGNDCPPELKAFLNRFCWNNSEDFRGETPEELARIMRNMFTLSFYCDFSVYPEGNAELSDVWDYPRVLNADAVDWILENVYNFDPELVARNKEADFEEKYLPDTGSADATWQYDKDANVFNTMCYGVGDGPMVLIRQVEKSGKIYFVNYEVYDSLGYSMDSENRYAILEEKTVDGSTFWSVHYDGISPDFTLGNNSADGPEYTEDEINEMVLNYHTSRHPSNYAGPVKSMVVKNANHLVTVCVYEEGYSANNYENRAIEWFCINTYTACGDSTMSGAVDLTE